MTPDPRRPLARLSDEELMAELRPILGDLPDPATLADLSHRALELHRAAYLARHGRGTAAPAGDTVPPVRPPDAGSATGSAVRAVSGSSALPGGGPQTARAVDMGKARPGSQAPVGRSPRAASPGPAAGGTSGASAATRSSPAHHAVAAEPDPHRVPFDGRHAGGAVELTGNSGTAPPATFDAWCEPDRSGPRWRSPLLVLAAAVVWVAQLAGVPGLGLGLFTAGVVAVVWILVRERRR